MLKSEQINELSTKLETLSKHAKSYKSDLKHTTEALERTTTQANRTQTKLNEVETALQNKESSRAFILIVLTCLCSALFISIVFLFQQREASKKLQTEIEKQTNNANVCEQQVKAMYYKKR